MFQKIIIGLLIVFTSLFQQIWAQLQFELNDSLEVVKSGNLMKFPWGGGLNYPQFSELDIDYDGDMDLFVFDRSQNNIRVFERTEQNGIPMWKPNLAAEALFPSDIEYRVAMIDYDGDGQNDLFTHANSGIKVYRNVGSALIGLQWQLITSLIYTANKIVAPTHLYVSSNDVPAYTDLDHDGDIDILTFSMAGDRLEYHKNLSIEKYGHRDSLVFELKNQCWGHIREDGASSVIYLNDYVSACNSTVIGDPEMPQERIQYVKPPADTLNNPVRHTGSTVLALDVDNSGVMDVIVGDVSGENLTLLINGGAAPNMNSLIVSQDPSFPSYDIPVQLSYFPAAYYLDVDFDGKKDLIVAPNARNSSENRQGILYYKNTGSPQQPMFTYQNKHFLQDEMIDNGTGGIPVFVDENGDEMTDLMVAGFFRYKQVLDKESVLQYYRNTGNTQTPQLTWVSDDHLGLSSMSFGLRTVPTFGDLDGDQDQDLIFGLEDGTLVKLENNAGPGMPMSFTNMQVNYQDANNESIKVGAFAFPQLFDINNDGLLDLLIGNKNGEIRYYRNTGTSQQEQFTLENDTLAGIDLSADNSAGYAAPHFFRYKDTTYLMLGGYDGKIRMYNDIENNLQSGQQFQLLHASYPGMEVEAYSSCQVIDLDGDSLPECYVGGDLGGIRRFELVLDAPVLGIHAQTLQKTWTIFPQPASEQLTIQTEKAEALQFFKLINLQGQELQEGEINNGKIELNFWSNGTYLIQLQDVNHNPIGQQKLIIQH